MATETRAPEATDEPQAPRARRPLGRLAVVGAVCVAWAVTLPRLVPSTFGDHGTYVSVAERILAGDRLYVDVWDNKDPLFYYVLAIGRLVSPLADVVVEVLWMLLAAVSVLVLARAAGASRGLSLVVGLGATPLLLTGPAYETGMTHLPGLALLIAATACAARSRWVPAGVLVGLLLLTKLILTPVAAGALLVIAVHRRTSGGVGDLARAVAAGVATLAAGIGALWLRGELSGWIDNFRLNADYADGELAQSQYGSLVGHLLRAFPEDGRGAGTVTIAAIVVVLLAVRRSWSRTSMQRAADAASGRTAPPTARGHNGPEHGEPEHGEPEHGEPEHGEPEHGGPEHGGPEHAIAPAVLWDLTLVTLGLALVVIAATATWPHHAQTLSVPGASALALVATRLSAMVTGWRPAAVLLVAGYAMAGALHPYFYLTAARGLPTSIQLVQQDSPDSTIIDDHSGVATYARAGTNDVSAHAVGLGDVDLVCPRFHQYSLQPASILDATAACLPRADALIVDDTLRPEAGEPEWNSFVARVRALVATGYDCVRTTGSEVCFRRIG